MRSVMRIVVAGVLVLGAAGCAAGNELGGPEGDRDPRGRRDSGPRPLSVPDGGVGSGDDAGEPWMPSPDAAMPPAGGDEICDNGVDDDGNGMIDDGCICDADATQVCHPGPDTCARGTMTCMVVGEFTAWGECGRITRPAEVCDNMVDDDCDGEVDEGCACLDGGDGTSPWQMFDDPEVICFGEDLDRDPDEFDHADIPGEGDGRWEDRGALGIDFDDPSSIPDDFCDGSHTGGVFTYFQTFVELTEVTGVRMSLTTAGVDDATELKIFNSRYPGGYTGSGWYGFDSGMRIDLSPHLARGRNRIVLTHLDDNPSERQLSGVNITRDGTRLAECR